MHDDKSSDNGMPDDAQRHWTDKYRDTFAQFITEAWEHREQTGMTTLLLSVLPQDNQGVPAIRLVKDGKAYDLALEPHVSHVMMDLDYTTARFVARQLAKINADSKETHADLCMSLNWPAARKCPICATP